MTQRRPTMADVGQLAGVSAQTVSRFFTGRGYVSEETRQRINAAIADLGYHFNQVASNLRVQRTFTIGMLTMGPTNYGSSAITTGLTTSARAAGYSVLTAHLETDVNDTSPGSEARRAIAQFLATRVDGIVMATPFPDADALTSDVHQSTPVIILAEQTGLASRDAGISYIAARLAVKHLIELGHRQILHVAGPPNRNEAAERLRGYHDELGSWGIGPLPVQYAEEWTAECGHKVAESTSEQFSAVFAADDELALGFMASMRAQDRVAPRDFSIIGVDDIPGAAYFSPPLTTVKLDFADIGRNAFALLLSRLDNIPAPAPPKRPRLIARASTAHLDQAAINQASGVDRRLGQALDY